MFCVTGSSPTYSSRGSQGQRRNHHQQTNSQEEIVEARGVQGRPAAAEAYEIELRQLRGGRNRLVRRPSQTSATMKTTRKSWSCRRLHGQSRSWPSQRGGAGASHRER